MEKTTEFQIDAKLMELLLGIGFLLLVLSAVFNAVIFTTGFRTPFTTFILATFLILVVLFLGLVFYLFIAWINKYRSTLFKIRSS